MPDIWFDVDTAIANCPINILPLIDDTDFKTIEAAVVYNAAGLALFWHFVTSAGVKTVTAVTPTTAGNYDWTDDGTSGTYSIEIPATGGASINNDTEGYGWFTGYATGILPWRGPVIGFRAAALNDALCDGGDNLDVNAVQWLGTACATPTVAGVPEVDITHIGGDAQSQADLKDFADAGYDPATNKVQGVALTDTLTTYTGNTPQTGDCYARIGAPAGASISADIAAVKADTAAVLIDTAEIGAAGAGLTNISLPATGLDLILQDSTFSLAIADAVWDEILTAGTHNIATSAGRRVREAGSIVIVSGTSPGTGNTSIRIALDGDASAVDGAYDPAVISIIGGTGVGQSRQIFQYDGANKYAYINRDWKVIPDATSEYIITQSAGDTHINEGVAQDGGNTSITLNALASDINDAYKGQLVFLVAGVGQDQARIVTAYNGTTKVATITPAWGTNPTSASVYTIMPDQPPVELIEVYADTSEIGVAGAGLTALASAANLATLTGYVDTEVAAIKAQTDLIPASPAAVGSAMTLTAGERTSIAGAVNTTQMTESYRALGAAPTLAQAVHEIIAHLGEAEIVGTTKTINKLDGATAAETFTLDSDTAPTSITRAT